MTWWQHAADVVSLCTVLACDKGGIAGKWYATEFMMVILMGLFTLLILFAVRDDSGDS